MSYSLNIKCFLCQKIGRCVDRHFLEGAISGIHQVSSEKGHLGSGTINLNCNNFIAMEPEKWTYPD